MLYEGDKAQHGAAQLNDERGQEYTADKPHHAASGFKIACLLHEVAPAQIHFASHEQDNAGTDGSHAQSADLDQEQQDDLPEQGEGIACVGGNQSRDAHRAGGGVQGVDIVQRCAVPEAAREHEQSRTEQNDQCKAHGNDAHGWLSLEKCDHVVSVRLPFRLLPHRDVLRTRDSESRARLMLL